MSDSIESVISASIASHPDSNASTGAGEGDTSGAADTDTGTTETATTETAAPSTGTTAVEGAPAAETPVAEVAATPADDTLEGLAKELAGKRDNRIPHSRVVKITEKAVAEATAKVRAEVEAEVSQYRTPEFHNGVTAMRVADENPEQFLQALAQADPRYAELLTGAKVLGGAQPAAGKGKAAPVAVPEGDVEPDIQLADGTLGYSADTTKAVVAQAVARVRSEMGDEFRALLKESLAPVEPLVSRERQNVLRGEAEKRVSGRVAEAEKKWAGFTENKEAIAAAIIEATKRGEQLSLHDAYIQVVIPKFRTDEATVRAKIHAEMNKAPAGATRIAAAGPAKVETTAADSDVDPITRAIQDSIRGKK